MHSFHPDEVINRRANVKDQPSPPPPFTTSLPNNNKKLKRFVVGPCIKDKP
jgi:hypothetical protein